MAKDSPRQREIEMEIDTLLEEWTAIEHVAEGEPDEPVFLSGWAVALEYNSPSMSDDGETAGCNVFPSHQGPAMTLGLLQMGAQNVG